MTIRTLAVISLEARVHNTNAKLVIMHIADVFWRSYYNIFFFKFTCLFLGEGEGQREGENPNQALHCQHGARSGPQTQNREIMT